MDESKQAKEFNLYEKVLNEVQKKFKSNYSLEYYQHMNQMVKLAIKLTIKEFIRRRIIDLEQEQKHAKGNDWKRGLLLLKANLKKDAGERLK